AHYRRLHRSSLM
ncbi:tRNA- family protein, partial [Vibrio parahaemolyticus 12310]